MQKKNTEKNNSREITVKKKEHIFALGKIYILRSENIIA